MHSFLTIINRAAQSPNSLEMICDWALGLDSSDRRTALQFLAGACQQAHPLPEEGKTAVGMSGLKPSFTPCVMLSAVPYPEQAVYRIAELPDDESNKSFRLLFCLFVVADTRRRETQCRGICTHEWHKLESISLQKS
jgi:Family of unknown function (DUF5958)